MDAVEEILDALSVSPGVLGVVVCTKDGTPIRDTFAEIDRAVAIKYANIAAALIRDCAALPLETGDSVLSLRVRASTCEIYIRADEKHLLIVLHDPRSN
jgi:predicted regulator of Ras-like GTPase activity (Roadblock/LC7/MglB family)